MARDCATGCCALRICRRPDGVRTAVAFSTTARFDRVVGADAPRVAISMSALHALLAEVGVYAVQLDPELIATAAPRARAS